PSVRAGVGAMREHRATFARVWLPAAVLLIGAAHLMLPIALSHAVLSVGILSGIAIVAIAAHVGLLLTLMRPPIVFSGRDCSGNRAESSVAAWLRAADALAAWCRSCCWRRIAFPALVP